MSHIAPTEQERMTPRARFYMGVVATRSLLLAIACLFWSHSFLSRSYAGMQRVFDGLDPQVVIQLWGVIFLIAGVTAVSATITGREGMARAALMMSIVTGACWAMGFSLALWQGYSTGPTGVIIWWALVLKDGSMLRQPLRNPFEPLVRRVLDGDARAARRNQLGR